MKYQEIKQEMEKKHSELFRSVGLFWAFNNEQWEEGRKANPIPEGEKYSHIGHGGYLPKSNLKKFIDGMEEVKKWEKDQIKAHKQQDAAILYELGNHECWYTGDISPVVELFPHVKKDRIWKIYKENARKQEVL